MFSFGCSTTTLLFIDIISRPWLWFLEQHRLNDMEQLITKNKVASIVNITA